MAAESIGTLIPTAMPGYADAADIQAALRVYHYGSYTYDPANSDPEDLVTPSMAKTIYDIQQDIVTLENRPASGGEVNTTAPVPGDFTPSGIPDGFIWVDQDGSLGGAPTSATAIFTNSEPTTSLTTGLIWVDKDPTSITANPYIPQAVFDAKGDLLVGTGVDAATRLAAGTNGFILSANSATPTGLEWIANEVGDITGVTAGTGLTGGGTSGSVTLAIDSTVTTLTGTQTLTNKTISLSSNTLTGTTAQFNTALSDGDFATIAGTETLTNKTLTSPTINGGTMSTSVLFSIEERANIVAAAATGTINFDALTSSIWYYTSNASANFTLNFRGNSGTTLNSILAVGDSITLVFMNTNGATPFYPTVYQIDGTNVTPRWQGGTAPTAGNANSTDAYTVTIIKTAATPTYFVMASQTRFA